MHRDAAVRRPDAGEILRVELRPETIDPETVVSRIVAPVFNHEDQETIPAKRLPTRKIHRLVG